MANQPADIAARANRAVIIAALIGAAATIITAFGGGYKVGANATPTVTVMRGWILCVKTTDDRIARLKVVEVLKFASIRADAVVWENE